MKQVATLIVAVAVLAVPQAAAKEPFTPKTVFGIAWQDGQTSVAELDALTLKPVSKSAQLGVAARYIGRSVGKGMRAAFVVGQQGDRVRFVDLARMKPERRVQLPCFVDSTALWETADRLVLTCGGSASSILVLDPVKQRLVSRKPLTGELVRVVTGNGILVGLLAPLGEIGPANLVIIDGAGSTRTIALPSIRIGSKTSSEGGETMARVELPAVAISPDGRRAAIAVIPANGPMVVVDLPSLEVTSRAVRSLSAVRKTVEGTNRTAVWTWGNTIAVTGTNWLPDSPHHSVAAGMTLIDADDWTSRSLSPRATELGYTGMGGAILASGNVWDMATQKESGAGLTGYDVNGFQRFHVFGDEVVRVQTIAGRYTYVADATLTRFQVVDTVNGTIVGKARTQKPTTLAPARTGY
jgi:hypothetical protein